MTRSDPATSSSASETLMRTTGAEAVTDRLGLLAAALRAQGSRVGVGELLRAHRALAAVDCASREEARLALRVALCAGKTDLERFDLAFAAVFGEGLAPGAGSALEQLASVARAVLPRAGIAADQQRQPVPGEDPMAVRLPGARSSCCATRTSHTTPTPRSRSPAS